MRDRFRVGRDLADRSILRQAAPADAAHAEAVEVMTPEERAQKIATFVEGRFCIGDVQNDERNDLEVAIVAALRAAENDALERAAKVAMDHEDNERSAFGAGASAAAERIADAIRALKG
jgi:hypothetical protein